MSNADQTQDRIPGTDLVDAEEAPNAARDWFLADLVRLVNLTGSRFSITLVIPGGILSGLLISGEQYFDEFAKEFSKIASGDKEKEKDLEEFIFEYGQIYRNIGSEDPEFEDSRAILPQFIHLKNARYFSPGMAPIPGGDGILWRGNLNIVSGFSFGQFSVRVEEVGE